MKRTIFRHQLLPWLLLAPQLAITLVFFLWPAGQAVWQSFQREDAFGLKTEFVGLANYTALFHDPGYLNSLKVTVVFALATVILSMGFALVLALAVDRMIRSTRVYTTLLVWPYAVAPAVAGILWWFLFNPTLGVLPYALRAFGYRWNHGLSGGDAMVLIVIAASWKQFSYNFLFFVAGLQSIPASMREAAAIDGAGPLRRLWRIELPLMAPTIVAALLIRFIDGFRVFDNVYVLTGSGPGGATASLSIYIYEAFFKQGAIGKAVAASVLLFAASFAVLYGLNALATRRKGAAA